MTEQWIYSIVEFLITYWVHSSLFIGVTLIAKRCQLIHADLQGEWLLKVALVIGILTSLLAVTQAPTIEQTRQALEFNFSESFSIVSPKSSQNNHSVKPLSTSKDDHNITKNASPVLENTPVRKAIPQALESSSSIQLIFSEAAIWLFYFWIYGVLCLLVYKLLQFYQLHRLLTERTAITDRKLLIVLKKLQDKAQFEDGVQLFESENVQSPLVFKRGEIILPIGFSANFNPHQIEAALAHELAHLKRKDTIWLKFGLTLEVVFFFQPLNALFNKVLHQVAEQRSDQLASEWTNNAHALAEAISVAAHISLQPSQNKMVLAMKSNKSNLLVRVEQLLLVGKLKTPRINLVFGLAFSFLVLVMTPVLSIQSAAAGTEKSQTRSHTHIVNGDVTHLSMTQQQDDKTIRIKGKLKGEFSVNASETQITHFPEDSYLYITYDDGRKERKLEVSRDSEEIEYQFYLDGDKNAFDQPAQQWFSSIIPEVFRVSGLNTKKRVARIKKRDGDEGVLQEVALINSDFVAASYLGHLLKISQLNADNKLKTIELSYDINSDFEQAKVLKLMLETQSFDSNRLWLSLLAATKEISSDFEQSSTLKTAVDHLPNDKDIHEEFFKVSENISSDFELRSLFSRFLDSENSNDAEIAKMLESASGISSDFEMSSLLVQAVDRDINSSTLFNAYLKASESISSDFEMARAFSKYLDTKPKSEFLVKVLDTATDNIGSDFELAKLLLQIAGECGLDNSVERALRQSIKSISSRHEKGKVLISLNEKSCS